jgi:hypothetical protein
MTTNNKTRNGYFAWSAQPDIHRPFLTYPTNDRFFAFRSQKASKTPAAHSRHSVERNTTQVIENTHRGCAPLDTLNESRGIVIPGGDNRAICTLFSFAIRQRRIIANDGHRHARGPNVEPRSSPGRSANALNWQATPRTMPLLWGRNCRSAGAATRRGSS